MPPLFKRTGSLVSVVIFLSVLILVLSLMLNLSGEKTIHAGEITIDHFPVGQPHIGILSVIRGSFTIDTPVLKHATIPSQGTGGACLVADLNKFDKPDPSGIPPGGCSKNSDCQKVPTGWSGYCDTEHKKCWVRPGEATDFCNRSKDYPTPKIWEDGIKNPTPPYSVSSFVSPGSPVLVEWRVAACLNQKDPMTGQDKPGCALEVFGKPTTGPY